ncbi:MAG: hypothetical protein OIN87_06675 [Candidatus Methanoperedens sp.]|nr:hypothetical protein [Candidatus Methanoperedens sp.]
MMISTNFAVSNIKFENNEIILDKELSNLDSSVIEFSDILNRNNIRHVLISGYIPILFGKEGEIEYIDILIQNISFEKFLKLWLEIENSYECKNASDPIDAYNAYLKNYHSVSISKKGSNCPYFNLKIIKDEIERYVLKYRRIARIGGDHLYIPPIEMQISQNLSTGNEKEINEARFLYTLFKEKLDKALMDRYLKELNIPDESVETYLFGRLSK